MSALTRVRIVIRGAVQGVGYRPHVYRLATELHLKGWVSNSTEGVCIEAEGSPATVGEFLIRLHRQQPPRAAVHSLDHSFLKAANFNTFEIRRSDEDGAKQTLVLPDVATCSDCLKEVFDPSDRRYLYPFTNCTNCGPRFTIIERLPYDRSNTTMRRFDMCERCLSEYRDPLDRRFHAQPNACPVCGPQIELWLSSGSQIAGRIDAIQGAAIQGAIDALNEGRIVAVKGLGGFHLIADAENDDSVRRLRRRKHREEKPFALMVPSLECARALCEVTAVDERAMTGPEAPIVLMRRRTPDTVANSVAPGNPNLGLMLPYTPLHHILMRGIRRPVVATSGNRSDEPIAIDEREAVQKLGDIADLFLVHDRPIRRHVDDSIVRTLLGREQILRRSRGYASLPVIVKEPLPTALGVGGHLKNTVAISAGRHVFISQHIGDLATTEALGAFRMAIDDLQTLYETQPEIVACDMHPDYASTRFAEGLTEAERLPLRRVQHHWAHVLACMGENRVDAPALGVAFDGAGYGVDGTIWGGEFLLAAKSRFRRVAHFRTFPLPGGDAAVKKTKHAALGLTYEILGDEAFTGAEPPLLRRMLEKGFRAPRTSSVGRLFDGIASLIGIRDQVSYEGQAAMELESVAAPDVEDCYGYGIREGDPLVVDWEPLVREVIADVRRKESPSCISAKFHNTLAAIVVDVATRIGEPRVLLSGGCFQNRYLMERTVRELTANGFCAYWHQRVPPNDGGIALGQIMATVCGL